MARNTSFELCTESLGFESGDCSVGEGEEELALLPSTPRNEENVEDVCQLKNKEIEKKEERIAGKRPKSFPPPLWWMSNQAGKPSSYMKSERKDGRLILTEVRVKRPELFQVTRENGRLRFCILGTKVKASHEEEKEEEMEPVRRDGFYSYQGERCSNKIHHPWWHQGFVMTA